MTIIHAVDPYDGVLKTWCGPNVPAPTFELAVEYCLNNGLGYCMVIGELVSSQSGNEERIDLDIIKMN